MRITESRLRRIIRSVIEETNYVFPKDKQIDDMWHERSRRSRKPHAYDLDRAYKHGETMSFREENRLDDFQSNNIAFVYYNNEDKEIFSLEDFDKSVHEFLNHYFRLDMGNKIIREDNASGKSLEDLVVNKLGLSEYDI